MAPFLKALLLLFLLFVAVSAKHDPREKKIRIPKYRQIAKGIISKIHSRQRHKSELAWFDGDEDEEKDKKSEYDQGEDKKSDNNEENQVEEDDDKALEMEDNDPKNQKKEDGKTLEMEDNDPNNQPPERNQQREENVMKPDLDTNYKGGWAMHNKDAGVSAMHIQLMPNNKAIWFDTTSLGKSNIEMGPQGNCPINYENGQADCWAHGVEYDIETGAVRTLKMASDPWCSSGGLSVNGDLVNTGGANKGLKGARIISPCPNCEFRENPTALSANRWYASNEYLDDGSFVVVGGRGAYNYEIVPSNQIQFPFKQYGLPLLRETTDPVENNLYPFVHLLPDGTLFIFANYRSIIIEPRTGKLVRELPPLDGGARNYPASGMSALLPLKLGGPPEALEAEVLICGGNKPEAFGVVDGKEEKDKVFMPALDDCGRIALRPGAKWEKDVMPSPRVMGDLLILPTGDLLILSGAKKGCSGWGDADEPNLTPVVYSPNKPEGQRFKELNPTTIGRMYHSSSAVLPDGQVLVSGSNPNAFYTFGIKYPTETSVEKFSPHYLDPALAENRPEIVEANSAKKLKYGQPFNVQIKMPNAAAVDATDLKLTMLHPPFTTHGYSHGQRMLILELTEVNNQLINAVAPPSGNVAPPGYYLLFVVNRGVPSRGMWVQIE